MGRKKGASAEECGSWMDTYGDMVTLLLCFFVMLYSMSSLNQQKWEVFVKSIFPNSDKTEQIAIDVKPEEGEYDPSGNIEIDEQIVDPENMEELYVALMEALNANGVEGATISREDGYTFLVFENQAFFEGDSSVLTDEAISVLDVLCTVLEPYDEKISQINIMGHTAQARADRPNNARTDRILSAMRSAEVAAYIQNKGIIEPNKLVGLGYGQYRSVAENQTNEGRAKNRRVEFLIIDSGTDIKSMNDYYKEYYEKLDAGSVLVTGSDGDAFTHIGGSKDGSSSMVPTEQAGGTDGAAQPDGAEAPDGAAQPAE